MKTKNIFKTLALAMLPTMLLTTSCSSDDDFATNNNENVNNSETTVKKGFEFPVTINVTRQGDVTRATYNAENKKLSFSEGDKLFVHGHDDNGGGAGEFGGILTWVSEGTFCGIITTEKEYTGTAEELFTAALYISATLLPAGYDSKGFLVIGGSGYNIALGIDATKTFASSKTTAVEQFSSEVAVSYSNGFALSPYYTILNFTITGLTPCTNVTATLTKGSTLTISGEVTIDGSGTATFAMGVRQGYDLKDLSLTIGGNAITISSTSKVLEKGHIYNITRTISPTLISPALGQIIGDDGKNYDYANLPDGVAAIAKICYVSGEHGLALAMADENGTMNWSTAITTATAHKPTFTSGSWRLATKDEWSNMISAAGSYSDLCDGFTSVGGSNLQSGGYWLSNEKDDYNAWIYHAEDGDFSWGLKVYTFRVRACFAF